MYNGNVIYIVLLQFHGINAVTKHFKYFKCLLTFIFYFIGKENTEIWYNGQRNFISSSFDNHLTMITSFLWDGEFLEPPRYKLQNHCINETVNYKMFGIQSSNDVIRTAIEQSLLFARRFCAGVIVSLFVDIIVSEASGNYAVWLSFRSIMFINRLCLFLVKVGC